MSDEAKRSLLKLDAFPESKEKIIRANKENHRYKCMHNEYDTLDPRMVVKITQPFKAKVAYHKLQISC